MKVFLGAALAVAVAACSDPGAVSLPDGRSLYDLGVATDAGIPPDAKPASSAYALPQAWLPRIPPCPQGWREVPASAETGDPATCEPYLNEAPDQCPDTDQAHFVGTPGCTRVGSSCPVGSDIWSSELPASASIIYVAADAKSGGEGTRNAPTTLGEAIDTASRGGLDVIALGVGTYSVEASLRPSDGVTLFGACVRGTVITAERDLHAIEVSSGAVTLRNLTLEDAKWAAVARGSHATLTMEAVRLSRSRILAEEGARLLATELVANNTATGPTGGSGEPSVLVRSGASGKLRRFVSLGSTYSTRDLLQVDSEGSLEVVDSLISRTTLPSVVSGGGTLTVSSTLLSIPDQYGFIVAGEGSRLTFSDSICRQPVAGAASFGHCAVARLGGQATVRRSLLERAAGAALIAEHEGSTLQLEDVLIRDGISDQISVSAGGQGVKIRSRARGEMRRTAILRTSEIGLLASSEGTRIDAQGLIVDHVSPRGSCFRRVGTRDCGLNGAGIGIGVYAGAEGSIEDFLVREAALVAIQIAGKAQLDLSRGYVEECPVGVNLQVQGYQIDRLTNEVVYRNNGQNLDSLDMPVP